MTLFVTNSIFEQSQNKCSKVTTGRMDSEALDNHDAPPIWRWVMGFLLVGMAWGLTTPFIRVSKCRQCSRTAVQDGLTKLFNLKRAAISRDQKPTASRSSTNDPTKSWLKRKISDTIAAVYDLLRNPAYAIPLLLNVTGSVWFFLLIGQAGKARCKVDGRVAFELTGCRVESHSSYYKFSRVLVHSPWRMVGRG